jgi:MarR family transcriptional regulator, lower aerobic nicotinate degradation pathway regulator
MSATPEAPEQAKPAALPKELLASTVFLLKRLGEAARAHAVAGYVGAGFSPYHHAVLALLAEGARETQAAIAEALAVDRSQLVGILDELEEAGLVERRRDPNDRRRHVVTMTPEGRRTLALQRAIIKEVDAEFLASLKPTERATLHDLLLRLAGQHDARFVTLSPPSDR